MVLHVTVAMIDVLREISTRTPAPSRATICRSSASPERANPSGGRMPSLTTERVMKGSAASGKSDSALNGALNWPARR